jgi:hypothetical protein
VSPELREQVELELFMLRDRLAAFAGLRRRAAAEAPDPAEMAVLVADCESVLERAEAEVRSFLDRVDP